MLNRKLSIALIFFFSFGLVSVGTGCDEKSQKESSQYQQVIKDIDEVEFQISREMILKSSSKRDKDAIRKLLGDIRNGFIRLSRNEADELGYDLIKRAVKELRRYQILENDHATLMPLIQRVLATATESARRHHIAFNVDWILYSSRFSEPPQEKGFEIHPLGSWSEDWALDRSHVKVKGNKKAWLIAPSFDFTQVTNPTFRIVHTININQNDRYPKDPWNRQAFLRKSFSARVSVDYKGGDPDPAVCECHWEPLDLGPMPSSKDFHTLSSIDVNLVDYSGRENVSLALFYDPEGLGRHYITWQVSLFEVSGEGILKDGPKRFGSIFRHSFAKKRLDPFQVLTQTPESDNWKSAGRSSGSYEWAVVGNNRGKNEKRTSSFLLSPRYELLGVEKPQFNLTEVINYKENLELGQMKIWISSDYNGGNLFDAHWRSVERPKDVYDRHGKDKWSNLNLAGISLEGLEQPFFTLLFWFDSKVGGTIWELKSLSIDGMGGSVEPMDFNEAPFVPPLKSEGGGGGLVEM